MILSTEGVCLLPEGSAPGGSAPGGVCSNGGVVCSGGDLMETPGTTTAAGGTHPTGMAMAMAIDLFTLVQLPQCCHK